MDDYDDIKNIDKVKLYIFSIRKKARRSLTDIIDELNNMFVYRYDDKEEEVEEQRTLDFFSVDLGEDEDERGRIFARAVRIKDKGSSYVGIVTNSLYDIRDSIFKKGVVYESGDRPIRLTRDELMDLLDSAYDVDDVGMVDDFCVDIGKNVVVDTFFGRERGVVVGCSREGDDVFVNVKIRHRGGVEITERVRKESIVLIVEDD